MGSIRASLLLLLLLSPHYRKNGRELDALSLRHVSRRLMRRSSAREEIWAREKSRTKFYAAAGTVGTYKYLRYLRYLHKRSAATRQDKELVAQTPVETRRRGNEAAVL